MYINKRSLLTILVCSIVLTSYAQFNGDGYYRVKNVGSGRYITVRDNRGSVNVATTSADMGAVELYKGFENVVSDPSSILYIDETSSDYKFHAQGTDTYEIIGYYLNLSKNSDGSYKAYQGNSMMVMYLGDRVTSSAVKGSLSTNAKGTNRDWYILPFNASGSDNYFGLTPEVKAGNDYYASIYASFPFTTLSKNLKAYYICKVDRDMAVYKEVVDGKVPAATPVFVKCVSEKPADNRLDIATNGAAAISENKLDGVYFDNSSNAHYNRTAYNANTMRVLGSTADGKLAYIKADYEFLPANKSYLNVPVDSPDEIIIISEKEYQEVNSGLLHTVTFMIGSEVVSSQTLRVGAIIEIPEIPTKEGYTFNGWGDVPQRMPSSDIIIEGAYSVNSYKITYMVDDEEYYTDSIVYAESLAPIADPVKEGYTFEKWVDLPATMPAKDVVVKGAFSVNSYKLTYMLEDEVYHTDSIVYRTELALIPNPTKVGYTFDGWSELPDSMPAHDVTIAGSFSINTYKVTYMVDDEEYYTDSIVYAESLAPIADPVKEGYTFEKWVDLPATMPAGDLVILGAFSVNSYKLTYMLEDEVYHTDSIVYRTELSLIPNPIKEGYTFDGWSELPDSMPARDVTITGCFTINTYKVTYMVDDEEYYTDSIVYAESLAPIADPVKEGYTFEGWVDLPATMPAGDLVILGTFSVNSYKLTYMLEGEVYHTDSIVYRTELALIPNPIKEGYTFDGWSELPDSMPARDVTIIGGFIINTYKVTYMVDDKEYYTDSIVYADSLAPIADPVKEGYTFEKWVDLPATMPAKDVVVKGAFSVNSYKITYVLDGEFYGSDSIAYNEEIIPLEVLDREGYTFSGWLDLPKTMPAGDLVIEGSFTINSYTITYMVDGKVYKTVTYDYGETVTAEEDLEKDGYVFSGWAGVPEIMPAGDVVVVGVFALNKNYTDEQGVLYSLKENKDGYTVSSMTQIPLGQIIIPAEINELPVTAIDDRAFMGTKGLTSIVIPANITTIGEDAFYGCRELLLVEWNTKTPLKANCFDEPERHGNMLVFVNDADTEVSYKGNVIVEGIAEQITISDDMAFRSPQQFTARNISFTRDFTKKTKIGVTGGWEAMVLPFDVQSVVSKNRGELKPFGEADFTTSLPYWLGELQADGTFATTQSITANKPFIMQLPNSDEYEDCYNVEGEVTFSATNVTVYPTTDMEQEAGNGYVMLGSYEGTTADSHVYALNDEEYTADGETYMAGSIFVANARDIRPFEAYVYTTNVGRAPYLRIGKETTSIVLSTVNGQQTTEIYNLTGRKVLNTENLKGGIYIVNGKKVVIK